MTTFSIKIFDDRDLKIYLEWLKSPCLTIKHESPCQHDTPIMNLPHNRMVPVVYCSFIVIWICQLVEKIPLVYALDYEFYSENGFSLKVRVH